MSYIELQRLNRENEKIKTRLKELQTEAQCLKNDNKIFEGIIHRQKTQIEDLKTTVKKLKKRNQENDLEREGVESRYLMVLQKLEGELQDYKKKYFKLENKIIPLMDEDTVRLKVLNEVETNHQMEISNCKNVIDELKDQILKYKRQSEVQKYQIVHLKMNHEEELRRISNDKVEKGRQNDLQYLNYELNQQIQNRLRNSYEQVSKEAQFYKQKYFASEKKYQQRVQALEREARLQFQSKRNVR